MYIFCKPSMMCDDAEMEECISFLQKISIVYFHKTLSHDMSIFTKNNNKPL